MKIKHDKEHFLSCNVAAFTYCDGVEVFSQLKVGKEVRLVREDENPHDHNAVAVFFGDTHIGYIPRQQNETIAKLLEMGWDKIFECRISKINPEAHYENQIRLTIKIVRNEK